MFTVQQVERLPVIPCEGSGVEHNRNDTEKACGKVPSRGPRQDIHEQSNEERVHCWSLPTSLTTPRETGTRCHVSVLIYHLGCSSEVLVNNFELGLIRLDDLRREEIVG